MPVFVTRNVAQGIGRGYQIYLNTVPIHGNMNRTNDYTLPTAVAAFKK